MARVIDIHTHVVPEDFPLSPTACPHGWPSMHKDSHTRATMMVDGKPFRQLDARAWDVDIRTAAMRAEGTEVQVLSPMPELLSYWFTAHDAIHLMRHVNAKIAAMVAAAPGTFAGLGAVPLQNPEMARMELDRIKDMGLIGIEVGASINHTPLGDPAFMPVLERARDLDLCVLVHSVRPPRLVDDSQPHLMDPTVGYPVDTALSVLSLMAHGVPQRLPELRLAFCHGGGALVTLLPRLMMAWQHVPAMREKYPCSPHDMLSGFYFDCLLYEPDLVRALMNVAGVDRVCMGSDDPFPIRQQNPAEFVRALGLPPDQTESVLWKNAARFMGPSWCADV